MYGLTVSVVETTHTLGVAISLVVLLLLLALAKAFRARTQRLPLPPGPKGHWLYGSEVPPLSWRAFYDYTKIYGPLFSIYLNGQLVIVIGTYDAAWDIMEKQGAALADRPRSIAAGETLSGGKRILLIRAGDRLRKLRRALHAQLQPRTSQEYEPIQARGARNLILDIIEAPDNFQEHAKRYAASVIISLTYGKLTPSSYTDPEVQRIQSCLTQLGRALKPGKYAVDSYPILKYVPGYLNELKRQHREELSLFMHQFGTVKQQTIAGTANACFAKYIIEHQQEYNLSDNEAAYLCGSMFGAGSDTTAAAIMIVVMAAACNSKAQSRAQEQLDLVVGRDRMPTFADTDDLPYLTAFVLEAYRWRPVSAGGFMHRATQDIVYKGYLIPKGASVVGNHWAICRDPSVYPDPESFVPERWLNAEGGLRDDLRNYNFGFGRRVCPGMHVANRSLFINAANILWAFKIRQDPKVPIDTFAFTDTSNSHPLPFRVLFERRFTDMKYIVENSTI